MKQEYKDLHDRMKKLWGDVSVDEFCDILNEEGYYDLNTRVRITEEFYDFLDRRYSGLDKMDWRTRLRNMKDGLDRGLEYRIYLQKQLKNKYKKEVK